MEIIPENRMFGDKIIGYTTRFLDAQIRFWISTQNPKISILSEVLVLRIENLSVVE